MFDIKITSQLEIINKKQAYLTHESVISPALQKYLIEVVVKRVDWSNYDKCILGHIGRQGNIDIWSIHVFGKIIKL